MTGFYGYRILYSGFVLLVLLCGVCVLAEETKRRAAGSSLILPLGYPKDSVKYAEWKYEGKTFALYRKKLSSSNKLQFGERLKFNNGDPIVEVTDLQLSDSGTYTIIADPTEDIRQLPTKTIILTVYGVIDVKIKSEQAWKAATNSCDVHLQCGASGDQTVSYRWSGFKEKDGAQLNFTLTPADGDVSLNCNATGSTAQGTTTKKVTCTPGKTSPGEPGSPSNEIPWMLIAAGGGGGAALILIIAIIGVSCWWKSHNAGSSEDPGNTVYEDVNVEGTLRKQSINVSSIYETVDEHRLTLDKPQTLYDKVTFARPPASGPSMPLPASQYQHVL